MTPPVQNPTNSPPNDEGKTTPPHNHIASFVPILPTLFLGLFGVLLASIPARNFELWTHLVSGRNLFRGGGFASTWLYDLLTYAVASIAGGSGLVACKAILCGLVAVLLFRVSAVSGWRVAFATTGLSVLAMGTRLLVQPETASMICLAVAVWLLQRKSAPSRGLIPDWRLVVLFAVWCNLDAQFVLGLGVVALTHLGRILDDRGGGKPLLGLGKWVVSLVILVAVSCLSPSHVQGLRLPADVLDALDSLTSPKRDIQTIHSPFDPDYFTLFRDSSAALSYYPLLFLGAVSFLLNIRGWRWAWALPWVGMAVVSGLEARTIPLFVVVAGPVTAWNLQTVLARRPSAPVRPRTRMIGLSIVGLLSAAFLVAAWPGWLQGPPHEPRRWAADCPPAIEKGAEFLRETHAADLWAADSRTLHVSSDTFAAFDWLFPQDRGFYDPKVVESLLAKEGEDAARALLREKKVSRVVAYMGDPSPVVKQTIRLLFTAPDEWRVIWLKGGLVVFAWDDTDRGSGPDPFAKWAVDFERLGYRPDESEQAPLNGPPKPAAWWEVFWTPVRSVRPPDRDEANVLLLKAEVIRAGAPVRQAIDWHAGQLAALVGAGGGWVGPMAGTDLAVRLTLFEPPFPEREGARLPPQTEMVNALYQRFVQERGSIPVGVAYAAVRAARRAIADNPNDASSYLSLAQAYTTLMNGTCEQGWAARVPQLQRVRLMQVIAALNKAVVINERLAPAHLELARLYRTSGFLDLAVEHLRTYRALSPRWGGPKKGEAFTEAVDTDLKQWTKTLESRLETFEKDSAKASVYDRADRARRLELGGKARDILLKSDVAAFGVQGIELEVDLLLRTGRPNDVLDAGDDVRGSLVDEKHYWFRAMAWLAVGDYQAADKELGEMIGVAGRLPEPMVVLNEVAELVGKGVLDSTPLGVQPHDGFWREPRRADMENRITDFTRTLVRHTNITVLRGVVALECGNVDRARAAFREPLAFAPNRFAQGGQLLFQGQTVMWDGLSLLGERSPPTR